MIIKQKTNSNTNISSSSNTPDVIDLDPSSSPKNVQLTNSFASSSSPFSSNSLTDVPRSYRHLSADTISSGLKYNSKDWFIVDMKCKKSNCWQCFGIPARKINEKE
ncbi:unnamed protein product [Adineta ricciae]|uniref:Uncharacterized protein n=1 Tax=Adineta ricciae TaxID=249248 RepID=A0A815W183_ADIRI|nr:unnamed protein product [Adineta ricciae]CAF1620224.1 unnamed protein product [Adineta ricciae]